MDLLIVNGVLADGTREVGFAIRDGVIVERGPELAAPAALTLDARGGLILPGFVESHLHLDVALMNDPNRPGRAAPFIKPAELNQLMEIRRRAFTRADIEERATRAILLAVANGATAMRAQCHVDVTVGLKHLEALLAVRERMRDQIDLQIVAFPQQGLLDQPHLSDLFHEAFMIGADVMGSASNLDPRVSSVQDARHHVDIALAIAMEHDVDLDMHVDMGLPEQISLDELEVVYVARRALEVGYVGRVVAGHLCALDSAAPDTAQAAIAAIKAAGISVISLPDMYRLARTDTRGVRRGLTRVKQLLAAGVNVAFASNNVRDAFRPLGNFDLLEEGLVLSYGAHMDAIDELETLVHMCTENAARVLKLPKYGLNIGDRADLVVLDAPSPSAALVDRARRRFVLKNGRPLAGMGVAVDDQMK